MKEWFERSFGNINVSDSFLAKQVYSRDASLEEGNLELVVWPKDEKQIHQILLFVKRGKKSLTLRGAGTNLNGSAIPKNSIVLDFSRMNKIIEINENKDYAIVQPGVNIDFLNKNLKNKFFPIITPNYKVATIGGLIALNSPGIYSFKFENIENFVEELDVILGNGKFIKFKGNLIKKFCGMEGTTGIIVGAKLKLVDKFDESLTIIKFDHIEELISKFEEIKNGEDIIAINFINKYVAPLIGLENKDYLFVSFNNKNGEIVDIKKINEIYDKLNTLNIILSEELLVEDFKLPLDKLEKFLSFARDRKIPCFGHLGLGIVHPCFDKNLKEEIYKLVKEFGGNLYGEYGIGIKKKNYVDDAFKFKIKNLKKEFDPDNLLNKGVVL